MVRIPQYNRSVAPQNTPLRYAEGQADPRAFGIGVTEALRNTGKSLDNLGNSMFELKAQYDKTKVIEVSNMLDKYINDTLNDKDNGYLFKSGKEAMGKSPEIMDGYDKYSDEIISKGGFWGENERYIRNIAAQKRMGLERYSEAHDREESDKWQDSVYTDALTNIFNKAINGRNNPADIEKFRKDGYTLLDNYALVKGWDKDPETFEMKKKEFEGNFNAQILDAYLAEGSLKASEYFHKHKDKFTPEVQNRYLQRIHTEEVNYGARTTAESLIGKPAEEAYKFIDGIKNIDERDATEREYNRLIRQKENIKNQNEKDALDKFYTTALEKTQKGESLSYSDIPDNLDAETKLNLMRYINSNGNPETDNDTWEMLYEKSVNDAQGFVELDLNRYRGSLSESEYKSFVKRQEDIRTGDYYTQIKNDDAMIDAALKEMKLNKGKKEDVAYSEIRAMVREFEARKGRTITDDELLNITQSLGYKGNDGAFLYKQLEKGMAERVGFIKEVMNDFVYYQNQHNGQLPPDEEKYKIIQRRVYQKAQEKRTEAQNVVNSYTSNAITMRNIAYTKPKPNEQKVLTYFADNQIPTIGNNLGLKLTVTSRYRNQAGSYHSQGRAADVSMSEHNAKNRIRIYERLLALPTVQAIGTSDPTILAHFSGNRKIVDERQYDRQHGTNHVNHAHVTLINANPATPARVARSNVYQF